MAIAPILATPAHTLVLQLQALLAKGVARARGLAKPILVSLTQGITPFDAVERFERVVTGHRFFWSQPGDDFSFVGFGAAQVIDVVGTGKFRQTSEVRQQVLAGAVVETSRGLPGVESPVFPLFVGGFSFDSDRVQTEVWAGFGDGQLVVPRLVFTQKDGKAWVTLNAIVGTHTHPADESEALVELYESLTIPTPKRFSTNEAQQTTLEELIPPETWKNEVREAAQAICEGQLEKAVLARAVKLTAQRPFNLGTALRRLSTNYRGCYVFAVAKDEKCFLGATPERLIRLMNGELLTMSLAGSIRRGVTPEEDDQLGEMLLASAKDRGEHAVVVQALVEALRETSVDMRVADQPGLLKLGNVQHLCTPITARLAKGYTLLDLVEKLHPTPAVGGRPRVEALKLIRERESLDRGWYAAPVGWLSAEGDGEFAVAIRSALIKGNEGTLFAGCGIVADSNPEHEYAESCLKLKAMLSALA